MRPAAFAVLLLTTTATAAPPLSTQIDARIGAALAAAKLAPAPRAEPHELVRRLYLDVIGRIPTPAEAHAFLDDANPDKPHALIDALLAHPEFPLYWRGVFDHWLNGSLLERPVGGSDEFKTYLERRLAANAGWDRIARELLDPGAADDDAPAAYFLASRLAGNDRAAQVDAMTTAVSSVFFGVQLQCAKCHDHPAVDDWKQENYYGVAAFLGRTFTTKAKAGNGPALTERPDGELKYASRGKEFTSRLLFLDGTTPDAKDGRRKALVALGVGAERPYFKRALANRVWKQLMGVGLVEPVDQIHDGNPASHPELLAELGDSFAAGRFDVRALMAGILHSEAYLRSSRWSGTRPAVTTYAAALPKPLTGPQMAVSLAQATGYADVLAAKYERDKAKLKLDAVTPLAVRRQFERERDFAALAGRFPPPGEGFQANASHALFLTYNPTTLTLLKAPGGLAARLTAEKDAAAAARLVYLTALARRPSAAEAARVAAHLATPGVPRDELARELVAAVVGGAEFRFAP